MRVIVEGDLIDNTAFRDANHANDSTIPQAYRKSQKRQGERLIRQLEQPDRSSYLRGRGE
jgi:hypothetical protein